MARYCFYVDGFNVYHALNDNCHSSDKNPGTSDYKYRKYKWLDYKKLAVNTVGPLDTVVKVYYFTAFAKWRRDSVLRHKSYIKVLRSTGVEIVQGRFMRKNIRCHNCNTDFLTHEEKGTDVNIALQIAQDAIDDIYDRAIIISSDSDLLPAIRTVHKYAPDKEVGVMFPIGRNSYHLKDGADFRRKMSERLLKTSQFDDSMQVGSSIITRPGHWS